MAQQIAGVKAPGVKVPAQAVQVRASVAAAGSTAEVAAADAALAKASLEAAAAQGVLSAAVTQENAVMIENAVVTAAATQATKANAASHLASAAANAIDEKSLKGLQKGALASLLSLTGLRGAVLSAGSAFLAGAVGVGALVAAFSEVGKLQQQLNSFQAVTGATASEMRNVAAAARELGKDATLPGVSAGDAAEALSQLAKAGLSVEDAIAGATGVLQLATAAEIDNATATELVANALNAFSLAGTDAIHVADLLTNAANLSQGSIADFGVAMQQVAAVSGQVGVSLEDTTTLLTLLARQGLRGSDAGTSLRTAFLRLAAPTKDARNIIEALGLQIRDLEGNLRPEVFAEFANATARMSADVRDSFASILFGQDAIRAAELAGKAGTEGLDAARKQIEKEGSTAEVAAAKNKGLRGELGQLGNTAEDTGISIGKFFLPALEGIVIGADAAISGLNTAAGVFNSFFGEIQKIRITPSQITGESPDVVSDEFKQIAASAIQAAGPVNQLIAGAKEAQKEIADNATNLRSQLEADLAKLGDANITGDARERVQNDVDNILEQLKRIPGGINALTGEVQGKLANALGDDLRALAADFSGVGSLVADKLPEDIKQRINQLGLTAAGRQKLKALGVDINKAMAQGIEDDGSTVEAARDAVAKAIAAGQQQIQDSVRTARGNLEGLGDTVGNQLADIIAEASPAAQRVDELTEALERLRNQGERRNLRFDLSQAELDLNNMKKTLAEIGSPNAEQQQAINETLAPFIEKVKDAKDAVKEADLTQQIDQQEKLKEQAQETAKEGIAKLVDQFQSGKLKAGEFAQLLNQQVAPALRNLPKANLGFSFTRDFRRNLDAVVEQAKALAGFLGTPGTTPGPQVTRPADARASAAERVADAQANLSRQLQKTEETADNTKELVILQRAINRKLNTLLPNTKPTRSVVTSGPDNVKNDAGKIK